MGRCSPLKRFLLATGVLLTAFRLPGAAAGEEMGAAERLAASAAAAGDYRGAAAAFRRALLESAGTPVDAARLRLALGSALLRSGDLAGARRTLGEFRRLYPHASPELLPGEIFAAEGRFEEARRCFRKLAEDSDTPDDLRARARLASARLSLHLDASGEALGELSALKDKEAKTPAEILAEAEPVYIYTLIRLGRSGEAAKELAGRERKGESPAAALRFDLLELYRRFQAGAPVAEFTVGWEKLRSAVDPHPDDLVRRILDDAAQLAQRRKEFNAALRCWTDAFHFAGSDAERRDVLKNIFYCRRAVNAEDAAETARQYRRFFPDAPDRAQLLLSAAKQLVTENKIPAALELFEMVSADRGVTRAERFDAARSAAVAAERIREYGKARRMLEFLEREAKSDDERGEAALLCGEYLFRRKDFEGAARRVEPLLEDHLRAVADRAAFLLLRAGIELKRIPEALKIADRLKDSPTTEYAAFADYQTAALTEAKGEFAAARKLYLGFLSRFADSRYAPAARFAAARLAERDGDFAAAAREFRSFATLYPTDPSAAAALFLAVRGACLADDRKEAEEGLKQLLSRDAAAPERCAALLCFAQYLRRLGALDDEEKLLKLHFAVAAAPADRAAMMLEKIRLLRARGRRGEAADAARKLLDEFPSSAIAADAALLAGDLLCDLGKYAEARKYFERAKTLRPAGLFGEIADGRLADCCFALSSEVRNDAELLRAVEIYNRLAENSRFPAVRLQSRFKAGQCREFLGGEAAAIDDYEQVLNYALQLRSEGGNPDFIWCSRAAHAAMRLLLNGDRPDRLQRAARIAARYRGLGPSAAADTDFRALGEEIRKRYKNREM